MYVILSVCLFVYLFVPLSSLQNSSYLTSTHKAYEYNYNINFVSAHIPYLFSLLADPSALLVAAFQTALSSSDWVDQSWSYSSDYYKSQGSLKWWIQAKYKSILIQ